MGWFSESKESKENTVENSIKLDTNQELTVNSDEITTVLIIIAILLTILVVMKIVSIIRKATKHQTQQEQLLLRTLNTNRSE